MTEPMGELRFTHQSEDKTITGSASVKPYFGDTVIIYTASERIGGESFHSNYPFSRAEAEQLRDYISEWLERA